MLPGGFASLADLQGAWYIAHTKARFEKAFAWDLSAAGTQYFLPMIPRIRFSGGRKRTVLMPLFTSYVFFTGNAQTRHNALATNRLCQVIPVVDQASLKKELLSIEKAIRGEMTLDPYPFAAIGQRVRIAAGPLMGLEGIVVERDKVTRVVLQVSVLGQGASVQIDADVLEPLDEDAPQTRRTGGVLS
ncbi:UpxY family transcription antiterminator [soil metagenome]